MYILLFPPITTITFDEVGSDFLKKPGIGYTFCELKQVS